MVFCEKVEVNIPLITPGMIKLAPTKELAFFDQFVENWCKDRIYVGVEFGHVSHGHLVLVHHKETGFLRGFL